MGWSSPASGATRGEIFLLLQYEPDSAPAIALKATIERTEKRFAFYAKQNLLCGSDGLPHLISDPGLAFRYGHLGEVFVSPCLSLAAANHGHFLCSCGLFE